MTENLEFLAFEMSGTDVFGDPELKHRLTKPQDLEKGFVVYATGPMGETRRFVVTSVLGRTWHGEDGDMLVSGEYQPDRYAHEAFGDRPDGGWAATCFGSAKGLERADFS